MYQQEKDKIRDKLVKGNIGFIKKPTGWATNCPELGEELSKRCDGSHNHIKTFAGQVKQAEIYSPTLVRAVLRGVSRALKSIRLPMCCILPG